MQGCSTVQLNLHLRVDSGLHFGDSGLGLLHRHPGLDQITHLAGSLLALGLQILRLHVRLLALGIQRPERGQIKVHPAARQARHHLLAVTA